MPQHTWIATAVGVCRHPRHVAVRAVGEKARETFRRLRDRVRPRDADNVEAMRAGGLRERFLQRVGIAQKSRSA